MNGTLHLKRPSARVRSPAYAVALCHWARRNWRTWRLREARFAALGQTPDGTPISGRWLGS